MIRSIALRAIVFAGLCAGLNLEPAFAQGQQGMPDVQVVNLQVIMNKDGSQSVITPKGDLAVLPGAGVRGDVAQIFFGQQGGFWYVDRHGKTVDLNPAVQSLQARRANAAAHAQQVPQYEPAYYGEPAEVQQQPQQAEQSSNDSRRGGGVASAVGTAAAAATGAMVGNALTNNYWNTPYGTPYYYGPNGHPYYYNNGDRRELDDINLNQNQKAVLYNKRTVEKQNQQKAAQGYQQRAAQNYQQQQNYYKSQRQQDPSKYQRSGGGENPFVNQQGTRSAERGSRSAERESRNAERGTRSAERGARTADRSAARASRGGGGGGGRARGGGGRRR